MASTLAFLTEPMCLVLSSCFWAYTMPSSCIIPKAPQIVSSSSKSIYYETKSTRRTWRENWTGYNRNLNNSPSSSSELYFSGLHARIQKSANSWLLYFRLIAYQCLLRDWSSDICHVWSVPSLQVLLYMFIKLDDFSVSVTGDRFVCLLNLSTYMFYRTWLWFSVRNLYETFLKGVIWRQSIDATRSQHRHFFAGTSEIWYDYMHAYIVKKVSILIVRACWTWVGSC